MPSFKAHVIRRQNNQALNPQCAQRLPIVWEIHECTGEACAWCRYGPKNEPYSKPLVTVIEVDSGGVAKVAEKGCNRHEDCAAAEAAYTLRHPGAVFPVANFHCHDDCCEDCF